MGARRARIAEQQAAIMAVSDSSLEVLDTSDTNSTYINNKRLEPGKREQLEAGDLLTLGSTTLKCVRLAGDQRPTDEVAPQAALQDEMAAREVGV